MSAIIRCRMWIRADWKGSRRSLLLVRPANGGSSGATRAQGAVAPKAAAVVEQLTHANLGREVPIILGGEVVTTHKIRQVIKGGEVQITSCAPGAAAYLVKQLRAKP